ncbi:MAG: helix-turn-helix domain-containing protein [Candidatus Omnitrophica bacterium]|nr:helix-turn-helix domain-containing protein [Candidatus Omnitrophota bacterium]
MDTIGDIFKTARKEKQVAIEEAAKQTRIHHKILTALEENKFEELPAPLYVKGFIRRYSQFLEIDGEELARRYMAGYAEKPKQVFELNAIRLGMGDIAEYIKLIFAGVAIAVVIILIYSLGKAVLKTMLAKHTATEAETEFNQSVDTFSTGESVMIDRLAVIPEPKPEIKPRSELKPVITPRVTVWATEIFRIKVSVRADCWVQVKSDGKIAFVGIIRSGSSKSWEAKKNINIWTGKAEVMSIELNGRLLDPPGDGVIKNIAITKQGYE